MFESVVGARAGFRIPGRLGHIQVAARPSVVRRRWSKLMERFERRGPAFVKQIDASGVAVSVGIGSAMHATEVGPPVLRQREVADRAPIAMRTIVADTAMWRYADGDETAFAELYDALAPVVIGYLRRRTRDRDLVEDLVQETFLRIHLHRGRYRRHAPVLPWVLTIAARLLANRVRGSQRASAVFSAEDEVGDGGVDATSPEQQAMAMELAERIDQAVMRLPERDREAFELVKEDGLSLQTAAPRLNTTALALKMRLFRVCNRLRRLSRGDLEGGHDERKLDEYR